MLSDTLQYHDNYDIVHTTMPIPIGGRQIVVQLYVFGYNVIIHLKKMSQTLSLNLTGEIFFCAKEFPCSMLIITRIWKSYYCIKISVKDSFVPRLLTC